MDEMDPRWAWSAVLTSLCCMVIEPVVLQGLWAWVVRPITGWPLLNWAQAFGLIMLVSIFTYEPKDYPSPKAEYAAARWSLVHSIIALPMVWVALWFTGKP